MSYRPQEIEKKWRAKWDAENAHRASNPGDPEFTGKPSYYVLDMFPYPSGSGLHVGHASGYIATDIVARKKRMEGFNVLHPMGWDAFGLPAEQYAIQTNQHPRVTTDTNTANFRRQLKLISLSYDWAREVDTSHPGYYKWTQHIFLQLYKKGLLYRKEMPVWWCEELKTVLANEEVINGRSERGNHPCERRLLAQWVFRITAYADRLLEDLEGLDWPEGIKKMQRDWIGKSMGAEVSFALSSGGAPLEVFTTRPDTLFGVTALVLAPEHPRVSELVTADQRKAVEDYRQRAASKSERERKSEADALTAQFTGAYVVHPLAPGRRVPVYIADYVLFDYGTGAVMAVPSHDERDDKVARTLGLERVPVIVREKGGVPGEECFVEDGVLINSGEFSGLSSEEARTKITEKLEAEGKGRKRISYRIRDWIFSRQRYWGEPIPLLVTQANEIIEVPEEQLPVQLPEMNDFAPNADGSSPLNRMTQWRTVKDERTGEVYQRVTDTMPGWAGSCWYYLRFMDPRNDQAPYGREAVDYWKQVDLYVGGATHAVMHLLYARFWHKALFDLGQVPTAEPFKRLFNQGMVTAFAYRDSTGRLVPSDEVEPAGEGYKRKSTGESVEKFVSAMSKSLRNVVNPDDVIAARGCDTFRLYEMFMGPVETDKPWADESISGCEKFLKRFWSAFVEDDDRMNLAPAEQPPNLDIERALHKALDRVNHSFAQFNFNTAIAGMMEMLNDVLKLQASFSRPQAEMFFKMLFPFAPHIASELWQRAGNTALLDFQPWPTLDASMLKKDSFELVIQVNGKVRGRADVPMDLPEASIKELAKPVISTWLEGKTVVREIYVPNKLLNIVVR